MAVHVALTREFVDVTVKRATALDVDDQGHLWLYAGTRTLTNQIAVYAAGRWVAATKLEDPETTTTDG